MSRQLTVRAAVMGMLLGGLMSLSNLYIALKTGWSFGVSITAGILAFAIFALLARLGLAKERFGVLENNAMQSVASCAGYMTGGGTVAAIPALMMITGEVLPGPQMFAWISAIALLGVVMAIPMKQQMIDQEQLRFPTGVAAAETLKALHDTGGGADGRARLLGWSGALGGVIGWFRDAHASWMPFNLPAKLPIPVVMLKGRPLADYSLSVEGSTIMFAAGAIMGFRPAWSLCLGALVNFGVLAPIMYEAGVIDPKLGYAKIVAWSVWFGSAMILTSGLLAFSFQWRSVVGAMKSMTAAFGGRNDSEIGQVPMSWFVIGTAITAPLVVLAEWSFFAIPPWMGVISVILGFFIAIVACRVTGETDTTPTGALGKITQVTFGVLHPGSVTTNLMTANVTGGVGLHAADLLTDLKAGYLLKADPRQQFWAQLLGVFAGAICVVPAYRLLVPTADLLGTDTWPAPAAQTWKGVAVMLTQGFSSLHVTAQVALVVGGVLGIVLVLLERAFPRVKPYLPSPAAFGLGFTTPGYNCISMFLGALLALVITRKDAPFAERTVVPTASGFIAGESLVGILVAALGVAGLLATG